MQRTDEANRSDDLIPEESEIMQRALKRLSPKDAYDRVFRMRRAFQVHLQTWRTMESRISLTA